MIVDIETAARLGGSAGLLGNGEPAGIASWPAASREAFALEYAKGRHCRHIAEGRTTLAKPIDTADFSGMSRAELVAQFNMSAALQHEFGNSAAFVAYAMAEQEGRAERIVGRVVS